MTRLKITSSFRLKTRAIRSLIIWHESTSLQTKVFIHLRFYGWLTACYDFGTSNFIHLSLLTIFIFDLNKLLAKLISYVDIKAKCAIAVISRSMPLLSVLLYIKGNCRWFLLIFELFKIQHLSTFENKTAFAIFNWALPIFDFLICSYFITLMVFISMCWWANFIVLYLGSLIWCNLVRVFCYLSWIRISSYSIESWSQILKGCSWLHLFVSFILRSETWLFRSCFHILLCHRLLHGWTFLTSHRICILSLSAIHRVSTSSLNSCLLWRCSLFWIQKFSYISLPLCMGRSIVFRCYDVLVFGIRMKL